MPISEPFDTPNLLLGSMSLDDRALLAPHLARVRLEPEQVLVVPNEPVEHAYFLESGVASIVSELPDTGTTEIGVFGREGVSGTAALLGAGTTPNRTFMQVPGGAALRIGMDALRGAAARSPSLQLLLLRYVQTLLTQVSQCAVSNAQHRMEARLARWLLMCHDRVDGDSIDLTHRFMSMMIAAQRSGVTVVLHVLEGVGAIRSTRGLVTVLDRAKLEELAGDAYGVPEAEYRRLIAPFGRSIPAD